MDEIIFSDYGMEIIKRSEKLYIRYDAGELVSVMKEFSITPEEAEKAKLSERSAYEVILLCEKRK